MVESTNAARLAPKVNVNIGLRRQSTKNFAKKHFNILAEEWMNNITKAKIFTGDNEDTWMVNLSNYVAIIQEFQAHEKNSLILKEAKIQLEKREKEGGVHVKDFVKLVVHEFIGSNKDGFEAGQNLGFATPAQLITVMLKEIQLRYLNEDEESLNMRQRIRYAIEKLNSRSGLFSVEFDDRFQNYLKPAALSRKAGTLKRVNEVPLIEGAEKEYDSNSEGSSDLSDELEPRVNTQKKQATAVSTFHRRRSVQVGTNWLQEFSSVNMGLIQKRIADTHVSTNSKRKEGDSSSRASGDFSNLGLGGLPPLQKAFSYNTVQHHLQRDPEIYKEVLSETFDTIAFSEKIGRVHTLPMIGQHFLNEISDINPDHTDDLIISEKLISFLNIIQKGYYQDVQYHNDLHGADVMQIGYLFLTKGKLAQIADLSHLDMVAFLVAGACHDFGHDGFNNAFHVNSMSDRAIRYHDQSVQENFHAAESSKLMLQDQNNFLAKYPKDELKSFRKRMVGCILATDMANHKKDLDLIQYQINDKQISKSKNNGNAIIDPTKSPDDQFEAQQQLLEIALHSSDLSPGSRDFATAKKWTYLLFEEFFKQGDIEKQEGLPVSFLCDRSTTIVASNQPGFINFIVLPLFKAVVEIMPGMEFLVTRARENAEHWKTYKETEEDKRVYETELPAIASDEGSADDNDSDEFSDKGEEKKETPIASKTRSMTD